MGRASRGKWTRRRAMMFELPGSLGKLVRSCLTLGRPDGRRAKKNTPVRAAWWFYQQHLAGGKGCRQLTAPQITNVNHKEGSVTINRDFVYPQFPSKAALLAHFKAEGG